MKLVDTLKRIREIAETLPDDDPDKLEMLNTEADYDELMEWALTKRNEHMAMAEANKSLSDTYAKRKKSFENKADSMKDIVRWILSEAKERKFQGAAGTVSIGQKPQGVKITDESKIPERFFKTERTLMKAELNKAVLGGETIKGAIKDNGGETLIIRSK